MKLTLFATLVLCILSFGASTPISADGNKLTTAQLTAANDFAREFYKNVAQLNEGNLAVSPISAYIALAITTFGAEKHTLELLQSTLHIPKDEIQAFVAFYGLTHVVDRANTEGSILKLKNKVFVSYYITPKDKFQKVLNGAFGTVCDVVDFRNTNHAAKEINDWVSKETNEKITEIVNANELSPSTTLLLMNTIYFQGNWASPFIPELTTPELFYVDEKTQKEVPTMVQTGHFLNGRVEGLPAMFLTLPYSNKLMTITFVLPDVGVDVSLLEQNMDLLKHERLTKNSKVSNVEMQIPKFKIESTVRLPTTLRMMGLAEIFSDSANFKGMAENMTSGISDIIQKVYVEVNERGTEAAAATSEMLVPQIWIPTELVQINRPSLVIIRMGHVDLFVSRLTDPTV